MNMLKKKLSEKLGKNGGFTLVEMLIVVAIIAILIAVSIPMVNSALEKARDATDDANFRSAAALGSVKYLTDDPDAAVTYYYAVTDGSSGVLVSSKTSTDPKVYESKCKEDSGTHSETGTGKNKVIKVTIDPTQTDDAKVITTEWEAK